MFRVAQPSDLNALTALFALVFGGTQQQAAQIMQEFAGLDHVFVAQQDQQLVASLCAVPVTLQGRKGVYYYGVCTHPDYRGKGIMSQLMQAARQELVQRGYTFACLIPAGASLFDFYAQRGFVKAFGLRRVEREIRRNLWAQADFDTVTAKALRSLRQTYAPDSVFLNDRGYILVLTDLYSMGATIVSSPEGYGIYFKKDDNTLEFVELFAEGDRAAEKLLEAARDKTGAQRAVITLGAAQHLFLGEGTAQDYGMVEFFQQPFGVEESYMRLMLDLE
ncbi:GNAT family N-acetyltransferase [uncultured Allofournierella sp.]|uniref:GNAT family N-acetyltransferase n=1 Tax=uncultured Allofournierella sp. TaxID=1940258 RepID=UPI0037509E0D